MTKKRYLLDTNTVSLLIRGDPQVTHSIGRTIPESLGISAVQMGELLLGLSRSPEARRLHRLVR